MPKPHSKLSESTRLIISLLAGIKGDIIRIIGGMIRRRGASAVLVRCQTKIISPSHAHRPGVSGKPRFDVCWKISDDDLSDAITETQEVRFILDAMRFAIQRDCLP